jgi:hypothetical protein
MKCVSDEFCVSGVRRRFSKEMLVKCVFMFVGIVLHLIGLVQHKIQYEFC